MKKRYRVNFIQISDLDEDKKFRSVGLDGFWAVVENVGDILKEYYNQDRDGFSILSHIETEDGEVIFSIGDLGKEVLMNMMVDMKERKERGRPFDFEQLWEELHEKGWVSFVNHNYSATLSGWCGVEIKDGKYYHNTDGGLIPITKKEAKKILQAIVEDPSTVF